MYIYIYIYIYKYVYKEDTYSLIYKYEDTCGSMRNEIGKRKS